MRFIDNLFASYGYGLTLSQKCLTVEQVVAGGFPYAVKVLAPGNCKCLVKWAIFELRKSNQTIYFSITYVPKFTF